MSGRNPPDIAVLAVGGAVGAVCAVALCLGLSVLARPSDFKDRLAAIEARTDRAERLLKGPGDAGAYPAAAACPSVSPDALDALRQRFAGEAARLNVTLSSVGVDYGDPPETEAGLTPLAFSLEGEGGYDAVVGMLDSLSKSQPEVFVDTLDLKAKTSTVALKLSGHMFCWTSAHP